MGLAYRLAKNYTLQINAAVLAVSLVALLIGWGDPVAAVSVDTAAGVRAALGEWALWLVLLGGFGVIVSAWYVGEQLWKRRKFERLLATDKRSEFYDNRKTLEELAKRLPDAYKPRIAEKEAQFKSVRPDSLRAR